MPEPEEPVVLQDDEIEEVPPIPDDPINKFTYLFVDKAAKRTKTNAVVTGDGHPPAPKNAWKKPGYLLALFEKQSCKCGLQQCSGVEHPPVTMIEQPKPCPHAGDLQQSAGVERPPMRTDKYTKSRPCAEAVNPEETKLESENATDGKAKCPPPNNWTSMPNGLKSHLLVESKKIEE